MSKKARERKYEIVTDFSPINANCILDSESKYKFKSNPVGITLVNIFTRGISLVIKRITCKYYTKTEYFGYFNILVTSWSDCLNTESII